MDITQCEVFYFFVRKFYILKDTENEKLDTKTDEGIFLGYSNKEKLTCA